MIDLERNSKKQLVESKGKRTRESSIYKPYQKEDFKISRGKFSDFLTCPRCFYLDRVRGLRPPGTPGWTLNETTDLLLKKEFDYCREKQIPHRLFSKFGLNNVIPYKHKDIDKWRNSLNAGLQVKYKNSNIILTGGLDDVWIDLNTQELIVVDYKSQAKKGNVEQKEYLEDPYHNGYKIQMDFYAYLLIQMGFRVKNISYFLVCNADRSKDGFYGQMLFQEYLIPYKWNISWVESEVEKMISLMNQHKVPASNISCNNCSYSNHYANSLNFNVHAKNDDINLNNRVSEKKLEQLNKDLENLKEELDSTKEELQHTKERLDDSRASYESLENVLTNQELLKSYVDEAYEGDLDFSSEDKHEVLNLDPQQSKSLVSKKSISKTAESSTVRIQTKSGWGSGIIIGKKNDRYTVLTALHVLVNKDYDSKDSVLIKTQIDQKVYIAEKYSEKIFIIGLDLVLIDFVSKENYFLIEEGDSTKLQLGDDLWVSGYGDKCNDTYLLYPGRLMGFEESDCGEELIYSNPTRQGSSGGAILNNQGKLVGINVAGKVDKGMPIGINIGIPIEYVTGKKELNKKSDKVFEIFNKGYQKLSEKNYKDALLIFDQVIQLENEYDVAFFLRAKCKEHLKDLEGALKDLEKVITLNPSFSNAYNNIGLIKRQLGDSKGAMDAYNLGLKQNGNHAIIYYNRAFLNQENDALISALEDFNSSIKIDNTNPLAFALRGNLLRDSRFDDNENALVDLNRAIELDPENAYFYEIRSQIKDNLGDEKGRQEDMLETFNHPYKN
mgnify:CR=1 FL=1